MRSRSSRVPVARQPIVDRHHAIVACELLYRTPREPEQAAVADSALATAALIDAAFGHMRCRAREPSGHGIERSRHARSVRGRLSFADRNACELNTRVMDDHMQRNGARITAPCPSLQT